MVRRLWIAGYGYIAISAAGTFLVRCIIDGTVFRGERLDFVGKPIIGNALLTWTPPEAIYKEGGYLDTRLLPDLSEAEYEHFKELVRNAKAEAEPERAAIREVWLERQVMRMVERGVTEDQARSALQRIAVDGARFELPDDFLLDFATLGTVTVKEAFGNPSRFDSQPLADPECVE